MAIITERSVTALILFLVGAGLFSQTFGAQYADLGGAFSPMFFPQIILGIWVVLTGLNLIAEVWAPRRSEMPRLLRVTVIALASFVFLLAMPRLGFFLSAVPFALLALLVLGMRGPLGIAIVALGVPAALVALFNHALTLPLPTSPFAWWF